MARRAKRGRAVKRSAPPKRASRPHRREIRVPGMSEPISHFTHVVRAGNIVFVSGCVASDEHGRTVGGDDATAQARKALENIKACLTAAGATFDNLVKMTIYLVAPQDIRPAFEAWTKASGGTTKPSTVSMLMVAGLGHPDWLIEIDAIAVVPS